MRQVSIIGIGETTMGKHPDRSLSALMQEAGSKAIADANINRQELQAVYLGNFNAQYLCGQGHLGPAVSEALQLGELPAIRVEGACASGSLAFRQAYIAVASGLYDLVLVGGVEKMTHKPTDQVTEAIASAADYQREAQNGMTFPSLFALIANRYHYEYTNPREAMTMCAMQNHDNACLNPDAQMKKHITKQDVINAAPVASPFTVMDCSLMTDGAVFLVLAAEPIAKTLQGDKRALIKGSGHSGSTLSLYSKTKLTSFAATQKAAKEAYTMAGLKAQDMSMAEVHDCFTMTQIINIEDLGFAEKGEGPKTILNGETARTGRMPINVSGGLKAKGHPIGATGLSQLYEIVVQLRGEAGARQLNKMDFGLAHNLGGSAGTCLVHILGRG